MDDYNKFVPKLLVLGMFLNSNPAWDDQIDKIYISNEGDVILTPRVEEHKIIFGDLNDISHKFEKLNAFYKNILPQEDGEKYKIINLKYKNQIVCKL